MTVAALSLLTVAAAGAARAVVLSPAQKRDCAIPSTADPEVLQTVYGIAQERKVSDRVMLATFETAWIESHANVLDCGDQDSEGVFQQRPSQGWGSPEQLRDVRYATNAFLDRAVRNDPLYPKYTAGQLAQSVQVSEYPDRYDDAEEQAKLLIALAQRMMKLPAAVPKLSASTSAAVPVVSARVTLSIKLPTATASLNNTMNINATSTATSGSKETDTKRPFVLAPGTLDATCGALYTPVPGDSCWGLQQTHNVSLAQLLFWNPSINPECTNMIAGWVYCVNSEVAVPPAHAAPRIDAQACTSYSDDVEEGETCKSLSRKHHIKRSRLLQLNPSLDDECSNLAVGKAYCITSIGS